MEKMSNSHEKTLIKNAKIYDGSGAPAFYIDGQLIQWGSAGEVTVNGKKISWESTRSGDDFVKLLKDIVAAKLGE